MTAPTQTSESGFTLIELLVSMTLLAMVFVVLFGGLRFGVRAWERGTTTADAVDQVRIAQDLLRSEIERACPRRRLGNPNDPPHVVFTGDVDGIAFLAPAPGAVGGARCVTAGLGTAPEGKLKRLVLALDVNRPVPDLLHGVQSMEITYRGEDGSWRSDWNNQLALPGLVRVRVTFPKGDARVWPELFVAPRISAEADCTYDPAIKSCRGG
jgi:general secretion pathway protein J